MRGGRESIGGRDGREERGDGETKLNKTSRDGKVEEGKGK